MSGNGKSVPIDLDEFDRYQSDQLVAYAGVMIPRMVEAGLLTAEDAERDTAAAIALATKLREDPPHAGQWVRIKRKFSYGDALDAQSLGRRRDEDGSAYHDEGAYRLGVMAVGIVAWSIEDEDGDPIERKPHACISTLRQHECAGCAVLREDLDEDLGKWLYSQIDDQRALSRRSREQMAALKSDAAGGGVPA